MRGSDVADYQLKPNGVFHRPTGHHIPPDDANIHWQEYQVWLTAGNTPDPSDPPPAEDLARVARRQELRANAVVNAIASATPAQIDTYIDNNVTTLAQARTVLKALAMCVSVLLKEGL